MIRGGGIEVDSVLLFNEVLVCYFWKAGEGVDFPNFFQEQPNLNLLDSILPKLPAFLLSKGETTFDDVIWAS